MKWRQSLGVSIRQSNILAATIAVKSDGSKAAGADEADRWVRKYRRSGAETIVRFAIGRKPNRGQSRTPTDSRDCENCALVAIIRPRCWGGASPQGQLCMFRSLHHPWDGKSYSVTRSAHAKGLHRHRPGGTRTQFQCICTGIQQCFVGPNILFSGFGYAARWLACRGQLRSACSVVAD